MAIMSTRRLVSLGYEGRTAEELVAELQSESVTVLVDVRLTPLSRKPGLSKRRLAALLADSGIRYVHLGALGNPKDNREGFRAGDPDSRSRFRRLLDERNAVQALDDISEFLDSDTVALLCFEREVGTCHRELVAQALLAERPALQLVEV